MAQTIVTNTAWTNLGAGPMRVQAIDNDVFIAIGTSTPSSLAGSVVLRPSQGIVDFDVVAGSDIFAMSAAISGSAIVATVAVSA
jgi:hypothetical protein